MYRKIVRQAWLVACRALFCDNEDVYTIRLIMWRPTRRFITIKYWFLVTESQRILPACLKNNLVLIKLQLKKKNSNHKSKSSISNQSINQSISEWHSYIAGMFFFVMQVKSFGTFIWQNISGHKVIITQTGHTPTDNIWRRAILHSSSEVKRLQNKEWGWYGSYSLGQCSGSSWG